MILKGLCVYQGHTSDTWDISWYTTSKHCKTSIYSIIITIYFQTCIISPDVTIGEIPSSIRVPERSQKTIQLNNLHIFSFKVTVAIDCIYFKVINGLGDFAIINNFQFFHSCSLMQYSVLKQFT